MKKWVFRVPSGHIYGPFDKVKVEELFQSGRLNGEEEVAEYPAGEWQNFSAHPELADIFLNSLSKSSGQRAYTATIKLDQKPSTDQKPKIETKILKTKSGMTAIDMPAIEMTEARKLKQKTNIIPLIILTLALALIYWGYRSQGVKKNATVSLIKPIYKKTGDPVKAQELIKKGWSFFYRDTFKNYVAAEEEFVKAVEEAPTNTDALVMLLMTDAELWPFCNQDSKDRAVIQQVLQQVSLADAYGPRRLLASSIADLILGNDANSKSQIDTGLASQPTEGRFYALKAQNFFNISDFEQSINYFEKAATLLSFWVKPFYYLGLSYSKLGQPQAAQKYLQKALQMNPNHAASRLELGVIEEAFYGHSEKAVENITLALSMGEKLLPSIEARGHYYLALIYQKQGRSDAAKKEAEKAYVLQPSDIAMSELFSKLGGEVGPAAKVGTDKEHIVYGDQYMRLKNYLAAQAQYKAAFEANPKNATAAMKAGEALWKLHQVADAENYLLKATLSDPKFLMPYIKLAEIKTARFDFDGAAKVLGQAIKVNPKSFEVYKAYGQHFLKRGDLISAEKFTQRALQIYESDSGLNQIASQIYLAKKEMIKAYQYAQRSLSLDARNIDAQVNMAKVKAQYQGVKSAQEYLRDLINTYPSELKYRVCLGEILIQDEQYGAAQQVLQQVLAFDNDNKQANLLLGDAYFLNNDYNKAIESYFSSSRVDPSDPSGVFRAGEVYEKLGKLIEAQKQFQLVIKMNPFFPRARLSLAKVLFALSQGDLALVELTEEKKYNPRLAEPYELAGDIYLAQRKFSQAAQEYQRAAGLKPQGALIYVKQARAYRAQHNLDAAQAMLRLATAKESGLADIYREQALVYEQKGQAEQAALSLKQYLRLEPNPPDKDQIMDKIKELEE